MAINVNIIIGEKTPTSKQCIGGGGCQFSGHLVSFDGRNRYNEIISIEYHGKRIDRLIIPF